MLFVYSLHEWRALKRHAPVWLLPCAGYAQTPRTFEVNWDVQGNGLQLPSVSTAKCGDVIHFKCPSHATHGVYKMTSVNGTCPSSFDVPSAGVALSAPAKSCDFSVTLGDEPDFFVTSQAPGACQKNLKMHVHSVCMQGSAVSASGALAASGMGATGALGAGQAGVAGVGTNVITNGRLTTLGSRMTPGLAADGAYTQLPPGMIESDGQYAMEAGTANAAGVQGVSMASLAGAALAAAAAVFAL
ncbi:hypothetical protein COO60DRAFT_1473293 [Scenedesmus sp. NREL 46B-D3]|nr:hypothetical protein COO60DRAFT_1473293 [Scenedesmus sp. NREL 46B-D3]